MDKDLGHICMVVHIVLRKIFDLILTQKHKKKKKNTMKYNKGPYYKLTKAETTCWMRSWIQGCWKSKYLWVQWLLGCGCGGLPLFSDISFSFKVKVGGGGGHFLEVRLQTSPFFLQLWAACGCWCHKNQLAHFMMHGSHFLVQSWMGAS